MNQHLVSRFELHFLDFTIQALSRSRMTRSLLMRCYGLLHHSGLFSLSLAVAASGVVGLFSGCLLYALINWR